MGHLSSSTVAKFFYEEIIKRFGAPKYVRTDAGKEFCGAFQDLCARYGIVKCTISTINPQANGLIERYNRTLQSGLRRMEHLCGTKNWWELIHDVVHALRVLLTNTTGYSAFEIVFK